MADDNGLDTSISEAVAGAFNQKQEKTAEEKVFFDPAQHLEETEVEEEGKERLDVDPEVSRIIKKYGSVEQVAKAYKELSKQHGKLGRRARQLEELSKKLIGEVQGTGKEDKKQEAPRKLLNDAESEEILKKLEEKPKEGLENLVSLIVNRVEGMNKDKLTQERDEYVQESNREIANNRAREILYEQAVKDHDYDLMEQYKNPNYQVSDEEYSEAFPQIEKEWQFILDNFRVKDGLVTEEHFEKMRKLTQKEKPAPPLRQLPGQRGARRISITREDTRGLEDDDESNPYEGMTQDEIFVDLLNNPNRARDLLSAKRKRRMGY